MRGPNRVRLLRIAVIGTVGAVLALLALQPHQVVAELRVTVEACKFVRRLAAPQGTELLTSQCGRSFSPRDPYVAIVTRARDVAQIPRVDAVLQVFDPDQSLVESYRWGSDAEPTAVFEFWDVAILPLAATSSDLAARLSGFQEDIIQLKSGRPFKDRPGTWTVRVTVNRQTYSLTFVLEN